MRWWKVPKFGLGYEVQGSEVPGSGVQRFRVQLDGLRQMITDFASQILNSLRQAPWPQLPLDGEDFAIIKIVMDL
jgi:hypothetical protein